ncbi:MAG: hypothetical protein U0636_05220 [Phycisphaerales bacterium]
METRPPNPSGGSLVHRAPGAVPLAIVTVLSFGVFASVTIAIASRAAFSYMTIAAALLLMSAALVATYSVRAIEQFVISNAMARFAFGLDAVLLAGTTCAGLVTYLVLVATLADLGYTGYALVCALVLGSAPIALHGLMIAFGAASPHLLLSSLRSLRRGRRTGPEPTAGLGEHPVAHDSGRSLEVRDLSPAGCCVALATCLVIFGGGIPVAWWLYGGDRPSGVPDELLALPIVALALAFIGGCILVARLLGVRLLRRG